MTKEHKTNALIISMAIILVVGTAPSAVLAMRNGAGGGQGAGNREQGGMVDLNNNGVPDGLDDDDGDGIINKDDPDYEKKYVNMRDDDGDGIPNKDDEDYTRPLDGSGQPKDAGQGYANRSEVAGNRQGQGAQRKNASAGNEVQNMQRGQNQVRSNNSKLNEQMRLMAQQEERMQQEIIQDIEKIKQTGGIKRLFFGVNKDDLNRVQIKLAKQEQKIEQLKQELSEVDDPQLQEDLKQKIAQIEETDNQLRSEIKKTQRGIFSWIINLFN